MRIPIQMTAKEKKLAKSYAKFHGLSLEEAFKKALFERIEYEYDISGGDQTYSIYIKNE